MTAVYDPGLQPERTLLAWRRTCLSFALASAVATRFTADVVGVAALLAGIAGVALALGAYVAASRRYRAAHRSLVARDRLESDGVPMLAIALAAVVLGVAAASYVLAGFLGIDPGAA
jgi:uncharacterized membrane protein YidH (DUF202 family)